MSIKRQSDDDNGYITVQEAAARAGRTVRTIRRWVDDEKVTSIKVAPRCRMIWVDSLPDGMRKRQDVG